MVKIGLQIIIDYRPSHEVVNILIKRFERLERTVWQAEPEESVGRKYWVRVVLLSNCGAAALQSARSLLMTYPTTTMDRVNC